MAIRRQVLPHQWLQLDRKVRIKLAQELGIKASAGSVVETGPDGSRLTSDGRTAEDLKELTSEKMQAWLGFEKTDPDVDLVALLELCGEKAQAMIDGKPWPPEPEAIAAPAKKKAPAKPKQSPKTEKTKAAAQ